MGFFFKGFMGDAIWYIPLVLLMCIGVSYTSADTLEKAYIDHSITTKKIILSDIPDGSHVRDANVSLAILGDHSSHCSLKLLDPILDSIEITDDIPCDTETQVKLTDSGKDALEYNLPMNQAKFTVTDMWGQPIPFNVKGVSIQYDTPRYFALVQNGTVINVIVADEAYVKSLSGEWIETFMGNAKRYNYAGIGYSYDHSHDAFIPPKPFQSWSLTQNYTWIAPLSYPDDGLDHYWNESSQKWSD